MAWTNSNWRSEATYAAQLAKLDLYIAELSDAVTANVTKGPSSRDSSSINQLIESAKADRPGVAQLAARETRGGLRRARFG